MIKTLFFLLALSIGISPLSAQINCLEKKIVGVWYFHKLSTKNGEALSKVRAHVDTVYFQSDKSYRWIMTQDSISYGTWEIDKKIKGIRLKETLTNEKADWYRSYGVKDDELGRIDLPSIIMTMDSFSFMTATEEHGELVIQYLKKR